MYTFWLFNSIYFSSGPSNPPSTRRRRHPNLHARSGRHRGNLRGANRKAGGPRQRAAVDSPADLLTAASRSAGEDLSESSTGTEEVYCGY